MKTTDPTEVVRGALSNHETGGTGSTRIARWRGKAPFQQFAVVVASDGVDGSDELEAAVGQSSGGVRPASGVSGAADVKRPSGEAT